MNNPEKISMQYPSPNFWSDKTPLRAIVLHATGDAQPGVMGSVNWLTSANSEASVNYVIGKDGRIFCLVDPYAGKRAWGNGILEQPDLSVGWLADCARPNGGPNPNLCTISIEHEQLGSDMKARNRTAFTSQQEAASLWLVDQLCRDFNIPRTRQGIIGHYQIQAIQRANCPGVIDLDGYVTKLAAMNTAAPKPKPVDNTDPMGDPGSWHCLATDKWVTNEVGFLKYWRDNGGLAEFGYPVTGAYMDGMNTIQYFERARLEKQPGNLQVLRGRVGAELLDAKVMIVNLKQQLVLLQPVDQPKKA